MKIRMKTGLSGPNISLAQGETKTFDDPKEAQRLINAGLAELALDESAGPIDETPAERVVRLKAELKIAEAEVKAAKSAGGQA